MSKFNKEQKIEIYRKWKDEKISISQLSKTYKTEIIYDSQQKEKSLPVDP